MATETLYQFNIPADISSVNAGKLVDEIQSPSSGIIVQVSRISVVGGTILKIFMKDVLSSTEETILHGDTTAPAGGLLSVHDASPHPNQTTPVLIQEEQTPDGYTATGGAYQCHGLDIVCSATASTYSASISFPFPISLLSLETVTKNDWEGDTVEVLVGEHTIIAVLTAELTSGNAVFTVNNSQYMKIGRFIRIDDGTNISDLGRIIDIEGNTITCETNASNTHAAGVSMVKQTVKLGVSIRIPPGGHLKFGESKIGGSYIPANTSIKITYKNDSAVALTFRAILEYLY